MKVARRYAGVMRDYNVGCRGNAGLQCWFTPKYGMRRGLGLLDAAVESEEQRLKLDADARSTMAAVAEAQAGSEDQAPGAWK